MISIPMLLVTFGAIAAFAIAERINPRLALGPHEKEALDESGRID